MPISELEQPQRVTVAEQKPKAAAGIAKKTLVEPVIATLIFFGAIKRQSK